MYGVQCVMIPGPLLMPEWSADNWDMEHEVENLIHYCYIFLFPIVDLASYSNAYFGQGTGPIHLDNVGCSGSESVLVQCNHLTATSCVHAEDAGVRCSPPGERMLLSCLATLSVINPR